MINKIKIKKDNGFEDVVIPVENGGTGVKSMESAREALGLGNTTGALPVANGGTGATSIEGARNSLSVYSKSEVNEIANDLTSVINNNVQAINITIDNEHQA